MPANEQDDLADYVVQGSGIQMTGDEYIRTVRSLKEWLKKTDSDSPASEYRKHLNSHAKGTGEWILETHQYKQWSQCDDIENLWIRGIPGCGKSVVAASLVSRLRRQGESIVLFFFFREIIQTNRDPHSLVQDFCYDLLDHCPQLVVSLEELTKRHSEVSSVPFDELYHCLIAAMSSTKKPICCVIDALDEMKRGDTSEKFLVDFLGRQTPKSVKAILVSRQVPHIERHMTGICLVDLRLDRRNVDQDIAVYLDQRLAESQLDIPLETAEFLKNTISARGKGLFLYARLMFDQVLLRPTEVLSQIQSFPDGLGDMYGEILHEHAVRSGTGSRFQRLILEWITHSSRPMRLLELAVMVDSLPDRGGLDRGIDAKMGIRTTCGPLLEVCEDGVVQILHHSLTEFALNRDVSHTRVTSHKRQFAVLDSPSVHGMITRTCLNYLQLALSDCPLRGADLYLKFYFLHYAVTEWAFHAAVASASDTSINDYLVEFLRPETPAYEPWKVLWPEIREPPWNSRKTSKDFPPLFIAVTCGIPRLARRLLQNHANPDWQDYDDVTLLMRAIERGHSDIARLLLQYKARHDIGPKSGTRPVHTAVRHNNVESLKDLIEAGADVMAEEPGVKRPRGAGSWTMASDDIKQNPFLLACRLGHAEIVEVLIQHYKQRALFQGLQVATLEGQLEVLRGLLQRPDIGGMINDRDSQGNTALFTASLRRDPTVVKFLLDHGADVNVCSANVKAFHESSSDLRKSTTDHSQPSGYTPIHGWAVGPRYLYLTRQDYTRGHSEVQRLDENVLQLLLKAGCYINSKDHDGRSALFLWSMPGYWDEHPEGNAMEMLQALIRNGADASILDDTGASPLHAQNLAMPTKVMRFLIESGVDVNAARGTDGATALMLASCHEATDPKIFHAVHADFHQQDHLGNTALSYYLKSGRRTDGPELDEWLKFSDPNAQNTFGRTPFMEMVCDRWSSCRDQKEVLTKMVAHGMSIHTRDYTGKTALLLLLSESEYYFDGQFTAMEELLRLGSDVQATDHKGKSVLHHIQARDYSFRVTNLLVNSGARPDAVDHEGNPIIHPILQCTTDWTDLREQMEKAMEIGCPLHITNRQGRTVLHTAVEIEDRGSSKNMYGYEIADIDTRVEFLLKPPMNCDVNAKDRDGVTPLHLAAASSDVNTSILISAGADICAQDIRGWSPLHFAAAAGQSNSLGLLIDLYGKQSLPVDGTNLKQRSALYEACLTSEPECVRLLLDVGASVETSDDRRRTPLHATAESVVDKDSSKSPRAVVKLLLAAGADPTAADENGLRPSDVAKIRGRVDLVDELRHFSSALNLTPLDQPAECFSCLESSGLGSSLERIFSSGNESLIQELLASKNIPLAEESCKSALHTAASHGWTSAIKLILPHVDDLAGLLPSLLGHATSRTLCNITMVEALAKFVPGVPDKMPLSMALNKLADGSRWWHTRGLSILLQAGALANGPEDKYNRPLHDALDARHRCQWRDEAVKILLEHGADPNITAFYGLRAPLNMAIKADRSMEIIELLIQHGASLSAIDKAKPPISAAISSKRDGVLEFLLRKGADPNGANKFNPLVKATGPEGGNAAVQILLRNGADPLHPMTDAPSTPFHEICHLDHRLDSIISTGVNLNARDGKGCTPLMRACMSRSRRTSECAATTLINLGVDLHAIDEAGSTALHHAIFHVHAGAVQAILKKNAMNSIRNHEGFTPFRYALDRWADDTLEARYTREGENDSALLYSNITALLDAGADPLEVFSDGRTSLHYIALVLGDYSNIDREAQIEEDDGHDIFADAWSLYSRLLDAGCDPEARDLDGRTAFFHFVKAPKSFHGMDWQTAPDRYINPDDCARLASLHGLDKVDNSGNTLLHMIAQRGWDFEADDFDENLFQIFLDLGLSPWKENEYGQTALDIATTYKKSGILALFARDD